MRANADIRPVVGLKNGVAYVVFPGYGLPVVVDMEGAAFYGVGVDDAEIICTTEDLEEALKAARQALEAGARKVDLEVLDENGGILELHVLHEEEGVYEEEEEA